jgi:hypothetical protein
MMNAEKRLEYLRGLSQTARERQVNPNHARHAILEAAFAQVQNQDDWKNPINAIVEIEKENNPIGPGLYAQAIQYFTGVEPVSFIVDENETSYSIRFVCEGYRLGPAGDH